MKRTTSRLPLLAVLLAVLLLQLLPSAAVARAIDASETQRLELPDVLVGPESVALDARGGGPYVSISDGRVLRRGCRVDDLRVQSELRQERLRRILRPPVGRYTELVRPAAGPPEVSC